MIPMLPNHLSDLHLRSAPMRSFTPAAGAAPDTSGVLQTASSKAAVRLPLPLVLNSVDSARAPRRWPKVCELMRKHSVPVYSTASCKHEIPAAAVPVRIAQSSAESHLDSSELMSADVVQVNCWGAESRNLGWPIGVAAEELAGYIQSLQVAVGGDAPVGMGFRARACPSDIVLAIQAQADFVSLVSRSPTITLPHLVAIRRTREACREAGRADMPIIVSLPVQSIDDVAKLLALGASVVALDAMLAAMLPAVTPAAGAGLGGGLLSSISGDQDPFAESLAKIEGLLNGCAGGLVDRMRDAGATSLSEFNEECLVSSSDELARSLKLPRL